jgi:hypothetical protein
LLAPGGVEEGEAGGEGVAVVKFLEIGIGAVGIGGGGVGEFVRSGEDEGDETAQGRFLLDPFEEFHAVDAVQVQIDDDQVGERIGVAIRVKTDAAQIIGGGKDVWNVGERGLGSGDFQGLGKKAGIDVIIFDEQDMSGRRCFIHHCKVKRLKTDGNRPDLFTGSGGFEFGPIFGAVEKEVARRGGRLFRIINLGPEVDEHSDLMPEFVEVEQVLGQLFIGAGFVEKGIGAEAVEMGDVLALA